MRADRKEKANSASEKGLEKAKSKGVSENAQNKGNNGKRKFRQILIDKQQLLIRVDKKSCKIVLKNIYL
ncbi:MAG: hypothetical protein ACLFUK_08390 [Halanaerobium sp.]